jgi:hypothetical protein
MGGILPGLRLVVIHEGYPGGVSGRGIGLVTSLLTAGIFKRSVTAGRMSTWTARLVEHIPSHDGWVICAVAADRWDMQGEQA